MDIYLIRHGIAAERGTYAIDDDRLLTDIGQAKTKKIAKQLQALGLEFDLILTSPLVRAQQTAEILLTVGLGQELQVVNYLAPAGNIKDWLAWLQTQASDIAADTLQAIALVGHEPDLGYWAETLVWRQPQGQMVVKKAGVIGIRINDPEQPCGTSELFWLTAPKFLLG